MIDFYLFLLGFYVWFSYLAVVGAYSSKRGVFYWWEYWFAPISFPIMVGRFLINNCKDTLNFGKKETKNH